MRYFYLVGLWFVRGSALDVRQWIRCATIFTNTASAENSLYKIDKKGKTRKNPCYIPPNYFHFRLKRTIWVRLIRQSIHVRHIGRYYDTGSPVWYAIWHCHLWVSCFVGFVPLLDFTLIGNPVFSEILPSFSWLKTLGWFD